MKLKDLTDEQKASIKLTYWNAPMDSDHEQITVALAYGYSTSGLQSWRTSGKGPVFRKVGRKIFYKKKDVEAFFNTPRVKSTSQYDVYSQRSAAL